MEPHSPSRGSQLEDVLGRLELLERRVTALEKAPHQVQPARAPTDESEFAELSTPIVVTTEWLPLVGRTLLVLGGGFVLRAITEGEWVPPAVGTALGIFYSLVWLLFADREGARARRASATWYGVATCLIAYPLLWEATTRFGFLAAGPTAVAVLGVTLAALIVVRRRELGALAWVVTLSAVAILVALAVDTKLLELFSGCLILIGLATLWLGYVLRISGPARVAALSAFGSVVLLTLIQLVVDPQRRAEMFDARVTIALQLSLLVVYVGSSIGRSLAKRRTLRSEEITLGLAATLIGLGGAIAVALATGTGLHWLGLVCGLLGAAGYWAAFALVDRDERRVNFVYFSSLALLFVLLACAELLSGLWLPSAFALATVAMAVIGTRWGRATLSLHGAVYALAGGVASRLLEFGMAAFGTPGLEPPSKPTAAMLGVLAGTLVYCAFPVPAHDRTWGRAARLPKLIVLIVTTIGLGGVAISLIAPFLSRAADGVAASPSQIAVLRSAVLAFAAVGLAWIGRYRLVGQAGWLVYPVLIAGGVKLLAEDIRLGIPSVLVASFVLYGGALILAPRLARSGRIEAG